VNETLAALGLEKHPDKTFIGRVAKGFDFLGYRLSPKGLAVAKQTWDRFVERAVRLQERERTGRAPPGCAWDVPPPLAAVDESGPLRRVCADR
jgi:hypothetical protein